MGVNSLPRTVTRRRRGCDLNLGPTAPESSTPTTRLPLTRQVVSTVDEYIGRRRSIARRQAERAETGACTAEECGLVCVEFLAPAD